MQFKHKKYTNKIKHLNRVTISVRIWRSEIPTARRRLKFEIVFAPFEV